MFFPLGPYSYTLLAPIVLLIPDSGRFSSAGHDGKRRAPSSSPRPSPRTAVRCLLLAGCDSDSAPICLFCWGRRRRWVSAPLIRLLRHPSPLPSPLPCWLASHTCCILYAYFKLRGAPMLQEPSVTACGVSSPCDKIEKSFTAHLLSRCRCVQPSHRPVTFSINLSFRTPFAGLAKHDVPTASPRMFCTKGETRRSHSTSTAIRCNAYCARSVVAPVRGC